MTKSQFVGIKKPTGDTAVDGLISGLVAGLGMAILLILAGLSSSTPPLVTLGYFDPAQTEGWLTGLLAHLAISAIYGVVFALLMGVLGRIRPSLWRLVMLWGAVYGLLLLAVAYGAVFTAVASPLAHIAAWQMAAAHLFYGLILGFWLPKNQYRTTHRK